MMSTSHSSRLSLDEVFGQVNSKDVTGAPNKNNTSARVFAYDITDEALDYSLLDSLTLNERGAVVNFVDLVMGIECSKGTGNTDFILEKAYGVTNGVMAEYILEIAKYSKDALEYKRVQKKLEDMGLSTYHTEGLIPTKVRPKLAYPIRPSTSSDTFYYSQMTKEDFVRTFVKGVNSYIEAIFETLHIVKCSFIAYSKGYPKALLLGVT